MKITIKAFALILAFSLAPIVHAEEVSIAVAANFTDATREIIPLFEKASGHTVKVSFGSTGKLFSQIEHGAPFQVFLAADTKRPAKAEKQGLAVPKTRFIYAKGKLVLWSAKADAFKDGEAYLKADKFTRAAITNPKTAPYGLAAQQVMEHLGVWEKARKMLVKGDSLPQTFHFTVTKNADIGFIALSQIKVWKGDPGSQWIVPQSYYTPIVQEAVLLKKGAKSPAARAFLDFLKGPKARAVIERYGYGVN
jgi:molybdate transport system substrate-binding protein